MDIAISRSGSCRCTDRAIATAVIPVRVQETVPEVHLALVADPEWGRAPVTALMEPKKSMTFSKD